MRLRQTTLSTLVVVVCVLSGCALDPSDGGRLSFALTLPAAEVSEIDSFGVFALDLDPSSFECERYLIGEVDPMASTPETVVAGALEYVDVVEDGTTLVLGDVPPGRWVILVECYDAGGGRIFMGCGDARVETGAYAELEIRMREDPLRDPEI